MVNSAKYYPDNYTYVSRGQHGAEVYQTELYHRLLFPCPISPTYTPCS